MSKVEVNTSDKSTLYNQGEYPVGYITRVIDHYVRNAETFKTLHENMKRRIKELESEIADGVEDSPLTLARQFCVEELKRQLLKVDAWWEPSMEDTSRLHSRETCNILKPM